MIVFPIAKINLGLNVVAKRSDGYHDLETVFYPVGLHDALEIIPAAEGKTTFTSSGIPLPGPAESNLCLRAFELLSSSGILSPASSIHLHLHKVIPMGAGLGGGSSDGAFTITMLNRMFALKLSSAQMEDYARKLGSDCPFFIEHKPVLATGRGDLFSSCPVNLTGYPLVIVKPDVHVSTADAYTLLTPRQPEKPIREIISQPVETWKDELRNDFEGEVFRKFPEIGKIKKKLYDAGAIYASMSGSGSAVYGIFNQKPVVGNLFPGCFIWLGDL